MHSEMRRVPAERARHAKRLGHMQPGSGQALVVDDAGATSLGILPQLTPITIAPTTQTSSTSTSTKQSSTSSASPSSTQSSATDSSSTSSIALPSSTHSLDPVSSSSSVVIQSITPASTSPIPSSTSTPPPVAGATNRGLSGGAIAGIIAGGIVVGIALIVFFVRKTYLRRRKIKRISWNGIPALREGFRDEPKPVSDVRERSASFIGAANTSQRRAPPSSPFDFNARSKSTYSSSSAPVQLRSMPAYTTPTPPSVTYNNPAYLTQQAPLTYNPSNIPTPMMTHGAAGTRMSSTLPSVGAQRPPVEALVKCTFVPSLPDELSITTGERVFVVEQYDDGWNLCTNGRGERGMVPRECLEQSLSDQSNVGWKNIKRLSSLNPDGMRY